jgi:hypothetical protein
MARNVTLSELVRQLRAEIGASTSVSQGIGSIDSLQQTLRRTQERIYTEYNWPFLVIERDEPLVSNGRYYTFDSEVNYDRILSVYVKYANSWRDVKYGFDPMIYNIDDSDDGETNDPVRAWRIYEDNQYEVWPVPSSNGTQILRFRCIRNLKPLIANTDVCDLDATMIVLFSAAEILQRLKAEDAQSKLAAASQHYRMIKGNADKVGVFIAGGGIRRSDLFPGGDWQLTTKTI